MNICLICKSPTPVRAEADARLTAGQSQASVARWLRMDRQVVGRHVRNGHVARGNPAAGTAWAKPDQVYVYSADEVAMNAWVDERLPTALAAATGLGAAAVGSCWGGGEPVDPSHSCAVCEVPAAVYDPVFAALEAVYRQGHQVVPGGFEPREVYPTGLAAS